MKKKIIIYQLFPRLFSNDAENPVFNGTVEQNGSGKFNQITPAVLSELRDFGVTHIWLTGIIRHSTLTDYSRHGLPSSHPDIVKGKAGSPYAISDYYDVDPDLAMDIPERMSEFQQLVDRIHLLDLKVIIDFVPNHVARDYRSLQLPEGRTDLGMSDRQDHQFSQDNNFYYLPGEPFRVRGLVSSASEPYNEFPARATGNDVFRSDPDIHDWYETAKLNYGIDYRNGTNHFSPLPDTWVKMTEILLFWSGKGIDGFRCDMAGMVPVQFWDYAINQVKMDFPQLLFIAELYEPDKYRNYLENGHFDYLYDKEGMYNILRSVVRGESSTQAISSVWQSLNGLDNAMLRFLENHDEQRIASGFFAGNPWKALPAMAIAALMNQGPVMIYAGQEVGEPATGGTGFSGDDGRTSIFDYTVMPNVKNWYNKGTCDGQNLTGDQHRLRKRYAALLRLTREYPVFANGYLYDLMWVNELIPNRDRIFAFLRYGGTLEEDMLLIVTSFDPDIKETRIKIPEHAFELAGFSANDRITANWIDPQEFSTQTLLTSQIVTIGTPVRFNEAGYAILRLG